MCGEFKPEMFWKSDFLILMNDTKVKLVLLINEYIFYLLITPGASLLKTAVSLQ